MNQELKKQIAVREKEEKRMQERRLKELYDNEDAQLELIKKGTPMSFKNIPFFRA